MILENSPQCERTSQQQQRKKWTYEE